MEGSAFDAAAPAATTGDPFGENGEGDFQQGDDPFGEETASPPPLVNREGEEIAAASAEQEAELAAAQEAAEEAGVDAATAVEPSVAEEDGVGVDMARQEVAAERAAQAEQPKPEPDADAADLNGAAVAPIAAADGSPAEAQSAGEDPAAPQADEAEAPKAKKGLRAYRLFVPEGNGKFAELSWLEDKAGKLVKPGTPGAKKQSVVLTREQDGALHHGFEVLGRPEHGAKLVAVADSQWTIRHIEPDPVQPVRQRLRIK